MKKHIPNFITLLNLVAGGIAIILALHGDLVAASWMIGLAALLDFMDGLAARLLDARSVIGNLLDSLADLVSFGVAPGMILYKLLEHSVGLPAWQVSGYYGFAFIALLVPAFSALRLATFSADDRQKEQFLGLPTPANALFFASLPLILAQFPEGTEVNSLLGNFYMLAALIPISCLLMVSGIPLFSLKFKSFTWQGNEYRYIFLFLSVALLVLLQYLAIPAIVILYLLISMILLVRAGSTGN